jgi:hypothetical protein
MAKMSPCSQLSSQLSRVGWYCQLPEVVRQSHWLPETWPLQMAKMSPCSQLSSQLSRVGWYCQLPEVECQSYWLPVHRCAKTTSSLWLCARATGVTSINSKCRFLTTGEPLPQVVFSVSPDWLILSAPQGNMQERLAFWCKRQTFKWRLYQSTLVGFSQLVSPCLQFSSQFLRIGWYCQLPEVVCHNCWLPAEKNQLTNGDSVSENSLVWILPLLFYSRVPLSFHENRGTKVATRRAPYGWKALIRRGATRYP